MLNGFAKNLLYNGLLIKDFKNPSDEMCIAAVKQNGLALEFIINQTPQICLYAVRQNGMALKYVKEQTEQICTAAYDQNHESLLYIKDRKLRKRLQDDTGSMILHPDMDIDEVIAEAGKTKTTKPPSGGFQEEKKQRSR